MNDFDSAKTATEEMFNENPASEEVKEEIKEEIEDKQEEEQDKIEHNEEIAKEQVQVNPMLDEAVNIAKTAAQAVQDKEMQLREALQELELLKEQNQQMQGTINELSNANKEKLVEEAMQMPALDLNALAFADDETIAKAQEEYAQKMAEYVKGDVLREVSPFVEQAKEGIYQKEKAETINQLSKIPELSGIETMVPQLDKIISNNKWLQSENMPLEEKLVNAYAIARGVNAINTPPEPKKELTPDDLMKLYDENPSFQELVEKKRLETIKQSQQVPSFSASSGAVNAAVNIKEKPKTFEEASERTRNMFGLE